MEVMLDEASFESGSLDADVGAICRSYVSGSNWRIVLWSPSTNVSTWNGLLGTLSNYPRAG